MREQISKRNIDINGNNSEQAYKNFIDTCKNYYTRYMYDKILQYFMSYLRIPAGAYDKER